MNTDILLFLWIAYVLFAEAHRRRRLRRLQAVIKFRMQIVDAIMKEDICRFQPLLEAYNTVTAVEMLDAPTKPLTIATWYPRTLLITLNI